MIELLIAAAMAVAALGVILALVGRAQSVLRVVGERDDLHQRIRAAAEGIQSSIRPCESVRPYRVGAVRDDGLAGIYYRPDTIAVIGDGTMTTYYWKPDALQLMQYDGGGSDLPVIDHVVGLAFDYFGPMSQPGTSLVRIDPGRLVDGPWLVDATQRPFDADVLRISEVRMTLRLEATAPSLRSLVPDEEVTVHAALRNSSVAR